MSEILKRIQERQQKKVAVDKKPPRKPRSTASFKSLEELSKKQIDLLERQNQLLEKLLLKKEREKIQVIKERTEDIMRYQVPPRDHLHADKSIVEKILNLLERGRSFNVSELRQYLIKFGEDEEKITIDLLQNAIKNLNRKGLLICRSNRIYLRSKFKLKITEFIKDIISLLQEKGSMLKKDIETHFAKHPSTIYRNLKLLATEGYIELRVPNRIFLTEKGEFLYSKIR